MTLLVFPIGQCVGTHFAGAAESPVCQVRLGSEVVELTDEEFAVWALAHEGEVTNDAVLVEDLQTRSLLAEVDLDNPGDFAARHRLLPLQLGLGNTAETPTMFSSGTLQLALTGMTRTLYDLWLRGHLSPNLLIACKEHDAELPAVLTALHSLLGPAAACLDLAVQEF